MKIFSKFKGWGKRCIEPHVLIGARLHWRIFITLSIVAAITLSATGWSIHRFIRADASIFDSAHKRAFLSGMGIAAIELWFISGVMAWQFGRRIWILVDTAQKLGEGELDARAVMPNTGPPDLRLVADSINVMAALVQKQMRDQRELLAGISHEIRSPLARMQLIVEMLRESPGDERHYERLENELVDINDLTERLLLSSRLDFQLLNETEFSLRELVEESARSHGVSLDKLQISLSKKAYVSGDALMLRRGISNLIRNAELHGEGLGGIIVSDISSADNPKARVEVWDLGKGFSQETRERCLEAFFRGKSHSASSTSLGLGLTLANRIVQAHRGKLLIEQHGSGGAVVIFELPLISKS